MDKIFNKTAAAALSLCILTALTGCGGSSSPAQTAPFTESPAETSAAETEAKAPEITYPVTIRAGYSTNEDDPRGVVLKKFKETVEKETDGNVLVEIHPSGELGSDAELISGLIYGSVDMTVSSAGNYAAYATKIGVSALPFLFSDFESAWAFIDSDTMKSIEPDLEQFNIHVLSCFDNGFRCVTTSEKTGPVKSVEDMKGLNIRTPENQIVMETMSALSANPKSFPFADLKPALADGTFDAQENPIPVIYNNKLYEVQKYLSITNHSYDAMPLTIRNDLWQSLKPEYRDIIESAAKTAATEDRELVKKQTEDFVSMLEEAGMEVVYPDLAPFKEATSGVIDFFSDIYGHELIEKVKAAS
ncbi:MAG: TRAP transporter substrate-binding protein [Oscillospiraceae bacterium]|nr:TRAP transporter substrate-binding protein [Oscillospiraceae bacterium]